MTKRNQHLIARLSPQDVALVIEMSKQGKTKVTIANALGLSVGQLNFRNQRRMEDGEESMFVDYLTQRLKMQVTDEQAAKARVLINFYEFSIARAARTLGVSRDRLHSKNMSLIAAEKEPIWIVKEQNDKDRPNVDHILIPLAEKFKLDYANN